MSEKPYLSIVVPVYNEEGNVAELHRRIVESCTALGNQFEIIFVDDGSRDGTVEACGVLTPLTLIQLRKNFGQTAAFDAGFKEAHGEVIVTMDGDLQNDPDDIGRLLQKMREGYDVVSGWRHDRKDTTSKHLSSRLANRVRKILLKDSIQDSGCSLKAYKAHALKTLDLFGEMHRFIPALLELDGYTVGEVKVSHHPRVSGVTKYNWRRGVKGIIDMIFIWFWRSYVSRPAHFFGGTGLVLITLGSMVLIWMAYMKLVLGESIADRIWPLMGVFLIMLGFQSFVFGLLVDFMMKNYYKTQQRMNYSIRSVTTK